ncbi:hypothetical protein [Variovorax sp.]|uniref:hypothetical protein n=1 Tax=Variovorax sp. TaxID=1871043 RepID=UPI003BABF32A
MLIGFIEALMAFFGCALLWQNAIQKRFRNFASSVFLLCYVPLFCIYPVIGRMLAEGAISVDSRRIDAISDPFVYIIFQAYNFIILIGIYFSTSKPIPSPTEIGAGSMEKWQRSHSLSLFIFSLLALGVFLYVDSTGLSIGELLVASRFEWFQNEAYSSTLTVISSYFIALAPAAVYLTLSNKKYFLLAASLLILIGYGALSKDRKWLIYIASGIFAAQYVRSNYSIFLSKKQTFWLIFLATILAFWQIGRGILFSYAVGDSVDLATEIPNMIEQLLTRGDLPYYYNVSATALHMNLNDGFSIPLGLLRRQLFFFLPVDYSFGLKVEDISAIFSDAIDAGDQIRRGNMPPSLIGLLVLSFEWWGGFIFAALFPLGLGFLDRFIRKRRGPLQVALISSFLSSTLLLLRGDDSSATYFIVFSAMTLSMIKFFSSSKSVRSPKIA